MNNLRKNNIFQKTTISLLLLSFGGMAVFPLPPAQAQDLLGLPALFGAAEGEGRESAPPGCLP